MPRPWTITARNERARARHGRCNTGRMTILYIIGGVWFGGSALLMVALGLAAKRPTPHYEIPVEMREAA